MRKNGKANNKNQAKKENSKKQFLVVPKLKKITNIVRNHEIEKYKNNCLRRHERPRYCLQYRSL